MVGPEDNLPQASAITLDNIQTVQKDKFDAFTTHLSPERLKAVRDALKFALGSDTMQ